MRNLGILLFTTLLTLGSCGKDDNKTPQISSRTLHYEVTGNYAGSLYASYTTASGDTTNDQISSLPWNKEISFNSNVAAANIVISGNAGIAGQQVTLIIKRGGKQVGTATTATADASGSFTKAAPVVVF